MVTVEKMREINGEMEAKAAEGDVFSGKGRTNLYLCEECHQGVVTVDRHAGVTPFLIRCTQDDCGGTATSFVYRVPPSLEPRYEWYRPLNEYDLKAALEDSGEDHLLNGGLALRRRLVTRSPGNPRRA